MLGKIISVLIVGIIQTKTDVQRLVFENAEKSQSVLRKTHRYYSFMYFASILTDPTKTLI